MPGRLSLCDRQHEIMGYCDNAAPQNSTANSLLPLSRSNMATEKVLAFDLYGTLLSTESIAKKLEAHFPAKAQSISSLWRRYQLEYTWRLNSMGIQFYSVDSIEISRC